MLFRETETIELKAIVVDDIKKEILAFANCNGGTIYVGVADNGEPIGLDNTDEVIQQITNMVRDSIKPDITMFLHYDVLTENEKQIVAINIQRGTNRPYYLSRKGLRPEGVYVRQGTSTVPASDTAIRQMVKETDGDSFESMRSLEQNLTFDSAKAEFKLRKLKFGTQQMQTLKILSRDGIYTNLALLLSDQCPHTTKVAVFSGDDQTNFKDRREFTGSLLKQLNDIYDFIDFHNQTYASFQKLLRIDQKDYPDIAVREALLNSLVHRDYSFKASTLISIYTDRIEFISIGGLLPGVEVEDIMLGLSVCRNQELANVFYRLQLIEAYGTGMKKIFNAYKGIEVQPSVKVTNNAFKIILPNTNASKSLPIAEAVASSPMDDEAIVLNYLTKHNFITRQEIEALLKTNQTSAGRLLRKLIEEELITQVGKGKATKYKLS